MNEIIRLAGIKRIICILFVVAWSVYSICDLMIMFNDDANFTKAPTQKYIEQAGLTVNTEPDQEESADMIYKLDFSDSANRGKNIAGNEVGDAEFIGSQTYTDNAIKGKTAIELPGGAVRTNYFTLPGELLRNDSITISFWAKIPSDVMFPSASWEISRRGAEARRIEVY